MSPDNLDKEIIRTLARFPAKTVQEMRLNIADRWKEDGHWPLYADIAGAFLGEKAYLWLGNVPTPIYFHNALERLERLGIVIGETGKGVKWRLSPLGLSTQRRIETEDAAAEEEPPPSIN